MGGASLTELMRDAGAAPLLPDVRPSRPPRDVADRRFGRLIAVARRMAALQADLGFREDETIAKGYSCGRYSSGHETCNTQEYFFLETFLKAEDLFQRLKKSRKLEDGADIVEVILNFGANMPKRPQQFSDCRKALFEVLVAAERRGDIIYLPVGEQSMIARYMRELAHRGREVQPSGAGSQPLPTFEVRCIGFSEPETVAVE